MSIEQPSAIENIKIKILIHTLQIISYVEYCLKFVDHFSKLYTFFRWSKECFVKADKLMYLRLQNQIALLSFAVFSAI